jgi:phospholipid/cholesterol/gamma-HCH transport system substrate-binding protein
MTDVVRKAPQLARVVGIALVVALLVAGAYLLMGGGTKKGVAYFRMANSINPGDSVNILGIEVGKVDALTPMGDKVRVDFHYDSKYKLPADVKAAVLSPTLVATRFVQLDPAYTAGPEFPDGGEIPMERTAVPVEFDELKRQLDQISDHFGPNGVNKDGALNRVLSVIDKNGVQDGVGQGQPFHEMITELSKAVKTFSDGRGDLFGTVDNLAKFSAVLNKYDSQIVEFQRNLGDVSATLDDNTKLMNQILNKFDDLGLQWGPLLHDSRPKIKTLATRAGSILRMLAKNRDSIAQLLHTAPNTLTNFTNLFHPRTGQLYGAVDVDGYRNSLASPGNQVCQLISQAAAANGLTGQEQCVKMLGPLFAQLVKAAPQIQTQPIPNIPGVPGVQIPEGSTPSYGDMGQPDPKTSWNKDYEPSPNGTNSDLPRSSTANGKDQSYSDNGFPIPGIPMPNPHLGGK